MRIDDGTGPLPPTLPLNQTDGLESYTNGNGKQNSEWNSRWKTVNRILNRRGPYTPDFFDGVDALKNLETYKILVIGAGGLGCEILKNLALSGFKDIHVIDMDTIDVSNLNRQFLFRAADVGQPKATTAANFVIKRVPGVAVTAHHCAIQDKDEDFYLQFQIIICGLDSVEARRWINATLVNMVDWDDPQRTLKPLIDGGTEGFRGQARVIIPTQSSCYECSLDMLAKRVVFPVCTIATTPRLPEHCIEWASVLEWPRLFPDTKLDNDNPEHIQWLFETASARAKEYDITGVTYSLTQGVVKNIIPAIASTNAIIAAACCNEAFKIATAANPNLDNYMMYTGNEAVYTHTFQHEKREECPVCGNLPTQRNVDPRWTLHDFIENLKEDSNTQLKKPSLRSSSRSLYMQALPQLEESTRPNLTKPLSSLLTDGEEVVVTDTKLPFELRFIVRFLKHAS